MDNEFNDLCSLIRQKNELDTKLEHLIGFCLNYGEGDYGLFSENLLNYIENRMAGILGLIRQSNGIWIQEDLNPDWSITDEDFSNLIDYAVNSDGADLVYAAFIFKHPATKRTLNQIGQKRPIWKQFRIGPCD